MATTAMYARLNSSRTEGTIVREVRDHESPSNDIPDGMVAIDVSGLDRAPQAGDRVTVDSDGCATGYAAEISVGDRVEAGEHDTEDHDAGVVLEINGTMATVGWDSCVRTEIDLTELRPEGCAATATVTIYAVRIDRMGASVIHSTHATQGAADDAEMEARADLVEGSSDRATVDSYRAELDGDTVKISRDGVWSGTGRWSGTRIEDCTADLGDEVYEALDEALIDAV